MKSQLIAIVAAVVLVGCSTTQSLHHAVQFGNIEAVKQYLDAGGDVNAKDRFENTPLHRAAANGHKEVAELLIAKGADVNAKAVRYKYTGLANLLRKRGGKTGEGWVTPLHSAAGFGHKEVVELLIDKGADVNAKEEDGWTLLHLAVVNGRKEMVALLIAKGADVNAKDEDGDTPLHSAAIIGHKEIVELLITEGSNVNAKAYRGATPLDAAIHFKHPEIAELLIAAGVDVKAKDEDSWTPLHLAAMEGHKEIVELLIEKGADVNAKDDKGRTPLDRAILNKQTKTAVLLRKHGGKPGDELKLADRLAAIEATLGQSGKDQTTINSTVGALAGTVLGQKDKLDKLQGLILGDGDAADLPSIEKLQGVFVIRGKVGWKYEVQYHTGNNDWQVSEAVTLQANRQLYIDSSSYDEKRFYRIKHTD